MLDVQLRGSLPKCPFSANPSLSLFSRQQFEFKFDAPTQNRLSSRASSSTMDRCAASTARKARVDCSSDAKENQEPIDVTTSAKVLVSASKPSVNKQLVTLSSPNDSSMRTQRRALHKIDNSWSRRGRHSPKRLLSDHSSRVSRDPIEAKKLHRHVTTSREVSHEVPNASEMQLKSRKRTTAAVADESTTWTDSTSPLELQESENLAWMDMMLALLEKRYDANSTLPVCVTDLEAANTFHLPQRKTIKTEIASIQASVDSRSRATATRMPSSVSRTSSKMPVAKSEQMLAQFRHEQEQTKERKRQRLLLRHAQQIQASTVASSTSCKCKTGCLKMYCTCFSSSGFCHTKCACDDCKNGRKNQLERVEAIQNYLTNDPRAFSFSSLPHTDHPTTGILHLLPQVRSLSC